VTSLSPKSGKIDTAYSVFLTRRIAYTDYSASINSLKTGRVYCCWSSSAQSILVSGLLETYDHIFCSFRGFYVYFLMGPLLLREVWSDYYWLLFLYWRVAGAGTHSLTGPLHTLTRLNFLHIIWIMLFM
jgi:hypothetical protein